MSQNLGDIKEMLRRADGPKRIVIALGLANMSSLAAERRLGPSARFLEGCAVPDPLPAVLAELKAIPATDIPPDRRVEWFANLAMIGQAIER